MIAASWDFPHIYLVHILSLVPSLYFSLPTIQCLPVGKSTHFMQSFHDPSLATLRLSLEIGTHPYQEMKSPYSLCQAYHLVWEHLSLLHAQWVFLFFCLSMYVSGTQTHLQFSVLRIPWVRVGILLSQQQKAACRQPALHWWPGDSCWPQDTNVHY